MNKEINIHVELGMELKEELINRIVTGNCESESGVNEFVRYLPFHPELNFSD